MTYSEYVREDEAIGFAVKCEGCHEITDDIHIGLSSVLCEECYLEMKDDMRRLYESLSETEKEVLQEVIRDVG